MEAREELAWAPLSIRLPIPDIMDQAQHSVKRLEQVCDRTVPVRKHVPRECLELRNLLAGQVTTLATRTITALLIKDLILWLVGLRNRLIQAAHLDRRHLTRHQPCLAPISVLAVVAATRRAREQAALHET